MKIALSSDEWHPIHSHLRDWLTGQNHTIVPFGSFVSQADESWVDATSQAAKAVADGTCEQGIVCCWSGTGASISANKIKGIRAALCWDEETVRLATTWNHPNVLVLPNRILTPELVDKMLTAWFTPYDPEIGRTEIQKILGL